MTYKLDGTESKNTMMGRGGTPVESVSTAKFDGPKLTITTKQDMGGGMMESTSVWTVSGSTLTIETHERARNPEARLQEVGRRDSLLSAFKWQRNWAGADAPAFFSTRYPPVILDATTGPYSQRRYRASSASNFRSSSQALSPVTGSIMSGATSASGPRTKKRSRKRGWGT